MDTITVALYAEGVDRNTRCFLPPLPCTPSPSTRRAGIEILLHCQCRSKTGIALYAEGVDRN